MQSSPLRVVSYAPPNVMQLLAVVAAPSAARKEPVLGLLSSILASSLKASSGEIAPLTVKVSDTGICGNPNTSTFVSTKP